MADPVRPRPDSAPNNGFDPPSMVAAGPAAPLPAGNGATWWSEGWRYFVASPWVWIGITVAFIAIMILLGFVPFLGNFASMVLAPVLAAGMMAGCNAQDRGGVLTLEHLFSGFTERLAPLMVVGLLYLAGTVAIGLIVVAIAVATIGMSGLSALVSGDPLEAGWTALATLGFGTVIAVLVGTLAALPLMMAYWFAPALVMLRRDEPVAAMKASFIACLVNIWPMLIYSLIGFALMIVASIPLGLGWFVLGPVFAASVYASYKDIFGAPA